MRKAENSLLSASRKDQVTLLSSVPVPGLYTPSQTVHVTELNKGQLTEEGHGEAEGE